MESDFSFTFEEISCYTVIQGCVAEAFIFLIRMIGIYLRLIIFLPIYVMS